MATLYEIQDNRIHYGYCFLLIAYLILSTIAYGNKEDMKTNYFEYWMTTFCLTICFIFISFFFFHQSFYLIYYILSGIFLLVILVFQGLLIYENTEEQQKTDDAKKQEDRKNKLILNCINAFFLLLIFVAFILSFCFNKKEVELKSSSVYTQKEPPLLGSSRVLSNPFEIDDY